MGSFFFFLPPNSAAERIEKSILLYKNNKPITKEVFIMNWVNFYDGYDPAKFYVPRLTTNKEIVNLIRIFLKSFKNKINPGELASIKWNKNRNTLKIYYNNHFYPKIIFKNELKDSISIDSVEVQLEFAWADSLWFEYHRNIIRQRTNKPKLINSKLLDWKQVENILKEKLINLL